MKIKLNEKTLNRYIQEAIKQELHENSAVQSPIPFADNHFKVEQFQVWFNKNKYFKGNLVIDGIAGPKTNAAFAKYKQMVADMGPSQGQGQNNNPGTQQTGNGQMVRDRYYPGADTNTNNQTTSV